MRLSPVYPKSPLAVFLIGVDRRQKANNAGFILPVIIVQMGLEILKGDNGMKACQCLGFVAHRYRVRLVIVLLYTSFCTTFGENTGILA
jgi:hypothetical protein